MNLSRAPRHGVGGNTKLSYARIISGVLSLVLTACGGSGTKLTRADIHPRVAIQLGMRNAPEVNENAAIKRWSEDPYLVAISAPKDDESRCFTFSEEHVYGNGCINTRHRLYQGFLTEYDRGVPAAQEAITQRFYPLLGSEGKPKVVEYKGTTYEITYLVVGDGIRVSVGPGICSCDRIDLEGHLTEEYPMEVCGRIARAISYRLLGVPEEKSE